MTELVGRRGALQGQLLDRRRLLIGRLCLCKRREAQTTSDCDERGAMA